jgi:hypothetical protein
MAKEYQFTKKESNKKGTGYFFEKEGQSLSSLVLGLKGTVPKKVACPLFIFSFDMIKDMF